MWQPVRAGKWSEAWVTALSDPHGLSLSIYAATCLLTHPAIHAETVLYFPFRGSSTGYTRQVTPQCQDQNPCSACGLLSLFFLVQWELWAVSKSVSVVPRGLEPQRYVLDQAATMLWGPTQRRQRSPECSCSGPVNIKAWLVSL